MLDFDKLDAALENAVGIAPDALLRESAPRLADLFFLARERLSELSEISNAASDEALERDRLASYFGCAYGDHGFLARAGALHTLRARLGAIAQALPRVSHEHGALGALLREAAILRALAEHRLSQPPHADDAPLRESLAHLESSLDGLAEFAAASAHAGRNLEITQNAMRLYGLADAVNVVADARLGLRLPGALAFVLERLADRGFTRERRSHLHALCQTHATKLRDTLWLSAQIEYARAGTPPGLSELRDLDLALEHLKAELSSMRRPAQNRADALGALYSVMALAHAVGAQKSAANMLDGSVLLLAEGLAAEAKRR